MSNGISIRGSKKTDNTGVQLTNSAFGTHHVSEGNKEKPRSVNCDVFLFKNLGILFRVLDDIASIQGELKNFRLICQDACYYSFDWCVKNWFVKLSPRCFLDNEKLGFVISNGFQCTLQLSCYNELKDFHDLLLSSKNKDEFIEIAKTIEKLEIGHLHIDELSKILAKKILTLISRCPNVFSNLKILKTIEFAEFTNCSLPSSLENFESNFFQSQPDEPRWLGKVNICGLPNLKSLLFNGLITSFLFEIKDLKNLQVIKCLGLFMGSDVEIDRREFPKLTSVIFEGKEIFEKSMEIITFKRHLADEPNGLVFGNIDNNARLQLPPELPALQGLIWFHGIDIRLNHPMDYPDLEIRLQSPNELQVPSEEDESSDNFDID